MKRRSFKDKRHFYSFAAVGFGISFPLASTLDSHTRMQPSSISLSDANELVKLPLSCIRKEYPYALGKVVTCADDVNLQTPSALHPAFAGCFDWHSCVHAFWSLIRSIARFGSNLEDNNQIIEDLVQRISKENIEIEAKYFEKYPGFERMYGQAWLLKLATEIRIYHRSKKHQNHQIFLSLDQNLQPLVFVIVESIKDFLPKLKYPIRCGTHRNTAFAMKFIHEYSMIFQDEELENLVVNRAKDFFMNDTNAPISWEPSGYDFLSPCLEEADLMRRVLNKNEFEKWIELYLPQLRDKKFKMDLAIVTDAKDGFIGHLYGLNFSRAWCLYGIANTLPNKYHHLRAVADKHINDTLPYLKEIDYNGAHWLGTFALLAQCESEGVL